MKQCTRTWLWLGLSFCLIGSAQAGSFVEEVWPWPNLPSMTWMSNGVAPGSGTLEWTYSNINPAEFDALWWTPKFLGVGLSGSSDPMTGGSLDMAGIATYTGLTSWTDPSPTGSNFYPNINTRIIIEIVGQAMSGAVPVEISSAAFTPGPFAIDVSGLSSFTVRFTAEAQHHTSGVWLPVNDFQQYPTPPDQTRTDVGGTFFRSEAETVPLPSSILLLGLGLTALRARSRVNRR